MELMPNRLAQLQRNVARHVRNVARHVFNSPALNRRGVNEKLQDRLTGPLVAVRPRLPRMLLRMPLRQRASHRSAAGTCLLHCVPREGVLEGGASARTAAGDEMPTAVTLLQLLLAVAGKLLNGAARCQQMLQPRAASLCLRT